MAAYLIGLAALFVFPVTVQPRELSLLTQKGLPRVAFMGLFLVDI